jgi:hypothetical protein
MTRTRIWLTVLAVAAAALIVTGVGVTLLWRNHPMSSTSNLTQQQAGPLADQYAADAAAHIPGSPHLHGKPKGTLPCDDPADNAPPNTAEVGGYYDLTFDGSHDNTQVFNQLHDYWAGKGYKPYSDSRNKPSQRRLVFENPADGFRIGIVEAVGGELTLSISSPCLKPGPDPTTTT